MRQARTLSPGIPGDPGERRELPCAVQHAGTGSCEVTLQPLRRYELDGAILFSDILTIPWAMGLGLEFVEAKAPVPFPGACVRRHRSARRPGPGRRARIRDGRHPDRSAGARRRRAAHRIRGESVDARDLHDRRRKLAGLRPRKILLIEQPERCIVSWRCSHRDDRLPDRAGDAGAQALMIFDTWGGVLTTPAYRAFSLEYMRRIVERIPRDHESRAVPVVLFTRAGEAGSRRSRRVTATRSGSTGRWIWEMRAHASVHGSRSRGIWTPQRCSRLRPGSGTR